MAEEQKLIPRLDDGSKSYYKRVESFLDGEEHDEEEEFHLFLENVVKQIISDDATRVCCDKDGSRAIERLLNHAVIDSATVQKLVEVLSAQCAVLAVNRCGSHVVEALMKATAKQLSIAPTGQSGSGDGGGSESTSLEEGFLSMCATVRENAQDFIVQPYASHVLSCLVQILSGVYFTDHASRSRSSKEFRKAKMAEDSTHRGVLRIDKVVQTSSAFLKQLDNIAKRISKTERFAELLVHRCGCPALQTLLRVLAQRIPDRADKLTRKIIKRSMDLPGDKRLLDSSLPPMFTDSVGSHLMECMIEVATPTLRRHIFDSCFKGRLMTFALHPVANYPLQQLISSATHEQVTVVHDTINNMHVHIHACAYTYM